MARRRSRRRGRRRLRRGVTRRVAVVLGALAAVGLLGVGVLIFQEISTSLPPVDPILHYRPPVATQILAADGSVIGEFFSEKRYLVPLSRIPLVVRQAFIAAEDEAFYRHHGVDPVSIARAFLHNLLAGRKVQGGSTITQQVVKSLLLTPEKSYPRKLKEIILAVRLERHLSKDRILELYLNHIYLGSGAYGVAAAAREYFGKDIEDVDLAEAALLAGLPQAPSRYSPLRHWPLAKARQRYVLSRMYEAGFIDRATRDAALEEPIALATAGKSFRAAPYFVEHVRRALERRYGHLGLYELGLRVHTTLDLDLQQAAERALRAGLERVSRRHHGYRDAFQRMSPEERGRYLALVDRSLEGKPLEPNRSYEGVVTALGRRRARVQVGPYAGEVVLDERGPGLRLNDLVLVRFSAGGERDGGGGEPLRFVLDPAPPVEGALVALDPRTGYVRALVGGYDFARSQFNRATQARRQPGSAFKPLVYAAAFDRDLTPASLVLDEPVYFQVRDHVWSPRNFEEQYYGPTTLRDALTFSRNVVTVKVAEHIGVGYLIRYLHRFGLRGPFARNLSIALGSAEVTPLELSAAYATFANAGRRPKPIFITEVTDPHGEILERHAPEATDAIPATTAYQITSILQDVITRGTGRRAAGLGRPAAGKTGTTNDFRDAWFVGYTPRLLATVWVGFDSHRSLGDRETGGRVAAPIWRAFMRAAIARTPAEEFPVPPGLRCVQIDATTGLRAVAGDHARLECFRAGTEPRPGALPAVQLLGTEGPPEPSALDFLQQDF